jgi:penicillin-binding protein 1A
MEENKPMVESLVSEEQKAATSKLKGGPKSIFIILKWTAIVFLWLGVLVPLVGTYVMLNISDDGNLPSFEELENPQSNLASRVFSADGVELGKYYKENRTNAKYNDLSHWLVKALVATEDSRYYQHAGIDLRALGRVVKGVATGQKSQGGGSTISQQLSKLLFPRKKMDNKWELVKRKFKEWLIATRLEKNYTKEEIITMYFNKFDFLNNAVGINSASQVYFGKTPKELQLHEAAMLVGMAKNPSLFNPLRREKDVIQRREVVLKQMLKAKYISLHIYDSVRQLPLSMNYTRVDHQNGLAPYFRESLRSDVSKILNEKDKEGGFVIVDQEGNPYDIYADGLKIYSTLDSRMQAYAEWAVQEHLKYDLQEDFFTNNAKWRRPPFSNDLKDAQIDTLMERAKRRSQLYKIHIGKICGYCERPEKFVSKEEDKFVCSYCSHETKIRSKKELAEMFLIKRKMKVFDWQSPNYEKDTIMTVMDSIRYYKSLLRASMVSIDPHTGYIKAWVGGPYFKHFKYDMVKRGKRQVGSTFKPFIYGTALELGVIEPCDESFFDIKYCVDIPYNKYREKQWCPSNSGAKFTNAVMPIPYALANSMNNITAGIVKKGKQGLLDETFDRVSQMGMDTSGFLPVPSMALGVFDLSVYDMVGAMTSFVNNGVYIKPTYIIKIEDKNGNIIYEPEMYSKEIWKEETAYTIVEIMKLVTTGIRHPTLKNRETGRPLVAGTAIRMRGEETEKRPYAGISREIPVAGKTGTTQNQSDGWFMGLTPDLVTGVWVGAEDRAVRFRSLQLGMGTNMALPMWCYYMKKVYADSTLNISQGDFEKPLSVMGNPIDCSQYKEFDPGVDVWDKNQQEW